MTPDVERLGLVAGVFLFAGWVKGAVGMGLPTVAMGALGMVMAPVHAAELVVVPSLVTNVWQFALGPAKRNVARRLASMMIFVCVGTFLGIRFLTSDSSRWSSVALGAVLSSYASLALFLPEPTIPPRLERIFSPLVGGVTGVLAGATGVFVIPAVPYLGALDLGKEELVQALGLSFTVSTIALAAGLGSSASYPVAARLASLGAVVPALIGMSIGRRSRAFIEPAAFRRWFLVALMLLGICMVAKTWVTQ